MQTLQFIPTSGGEKLNLPGASFGYGFFAVGGMLSDIGSGEIYITEGVGQAWAANFATNAALPDDKPNNYDVNDYLMEHGRDPLARLLNQTLKAAKLRDTKTRIDASTSFNETLDSEQNYCSVDLLSHVDDNHLLRRLSE